MKTIIIILIIHFILKSLFKNTKTYHEAALLYEVRKHIDDNSISKGLIMNTIKSRAAEEWLSGKIRDEFYKKIFIGGTTTEAWWEINRENIMNS